MQRMNSNNLVYMQLCLFPAPIGNDLLRIQIIANRVASLASHFELVSGQDRLKGELTWETRSQIAQRRLLGEEWDLKYFFKFSKLIILFFEIFEMNILIFEISKTDHLIFWSFWN